MGRCVWSGGWGGVWDCRTRGMLTTHPPRRNHPSNQQRQVAAAVQLAFEVSLGGTAGAAKGWGRCLAVRVGEDLSGLRSQLGNALAEESQRRGLRPVAVVAYIEVGAGRGRMTAGGMCCLRKVLWVSMLWVWLLRSMCQGLQDSHCCILRTILHLTPPSSCLCAPTGRHERPDANQVQPALDWRGGHNGRERAARRWRTPECQQLHLQRGGV